MNGTDAGAESASSASADAWVTVNLTSADCGSFVKTVASGRRTRRRISIVFFLVVVAFVAIQNPVSAIPGVLGALILLLAWRVRTRAEYRRFVEVRSGQIRLSDAGFEFRSKTRRESIDWSVFDRVVETPDHIFLMTGKAAGWIVPKRCLSSEGSAAAFARRAGGFVHENSSLEVLESEQ
jgi:hypothetical protein